MFRRPPQQNVRAPRSVRPLRPALAAVVAVCVGLAVLGASCTGSDNAADPTGSTTTSFTLPPVDKTEPIPTVTVPEGFVLVDARGVKLTPFDSKPKGATPPLPVLGGGATIAGRVTGPEGPVAGATVLLERVVGNQQASIAVATGGDGRYEAKGIHGGKYRVRAWLAPTLASRASTLVYLADLDGQATVDLAVEQFTGRSLQLGLDLTAVNVGETARLRALLTDRVVRNDGVVVGQPVSSASITLTSSGPMHYDNALGTTNAQGISSWKVTCTAEGSTTFNAVTEGASAGYTSPSCGPKPASAPDGLVVPDFPVGQEFDVPHSGVLPAGTYVTFLDGCQTTYALYANGAWRPDRYTASGKTMVLAGPAREFRPVDGTKGCTYRRQS